MSSVRPSHLPQSCQRHQVNLLKLSQGLLLRWKEGPTRTGTSQNFTSPQGGFGTKGLLWRACGLLEKFFQWNQLT